MTEETRGEHIPPWERITTRVILAQLHSNLKDLWTPEQLQAVRAALDYLYATTDAEIAGAEDEMKGMLKWMAGRVHGHRCAWYGAPENDPPLTMNMLDE